MSEPSFLRRNLGTILTLGLALTIAGAALAMHAAGWRDSTSILSGTEPEAGGSIGQGLAYALTWFLFVLGTPVLVLSAVFYRVLERLFPERQATEGAG